MPVRNSKQTWAVGSTVKVGWMVLRVDGMARNDDKYLPDEYQLTDERTGKRYTFTPHNGLNRAD